MSTRLIGGVIMTHADDEGLVVPPMIAPYQIVFVPVIKKQEDEQDGATNPDIRFSKLDQIDKEYEDNGYFSDGIWLKEPIELNKLFNFFKIVIKSSSPGTARG